MIGLRLLDSAPFTTTNLKMKTRWSFARGTWSTWWRSATMAGLSEHRREPGYSEPSPETMSHKSSYSVARRRHCRYYNRVHGCTAYMSAGNYNFICFIWSKETFLYTIRICILLIINAIKKSLFWRGKLFLVDMSALRYVVYVYVKL